MVHTLAFDWQPGVGYRWAPLSVSDAGKTGFTELSPIQTGIDFTNSLPAERYLTNQILLNGSGVAAGDVDGDGMCDLFFAGVDRPSVLYRNLGNWKFADITASAGVACAGQPSSGAVLADIDGDRDLDLLVNGVGTGTRLFLNNGQGRFTETTSHSGLLSRAGSSSLALADIDGDGDLEVYVANYRTTTFRDEFEARFKAAVTNGQYEILAVNGRPVTEPDLVGRYTVDRVMGILENGEADVLYRNEGQGKFVPLSWTNGAFLDESGKPIKMPYDWALSVMFRDLNQDGAPDIYVCNDFHSEDRIWINDGRGHFRALPRLAIRQTSIFSMGIDFADIDRDGHDDFFVADMLSRRHVYRQIQLMDRLPFQFPPGLFDNRPQYSRNTLFWNRGDTTFAEIAQFSGVEASDWNWCPVFMDVDLDGYEDLLAITGHLRDAQNIDIARRIESQMKAKAMTRLEKLRLRHQFTRLEVPNYAFRNRGNRTFEDLGSAWGFDSRKVSQGIALADLDQDGDLDVAINCLDDGPLILRNNTPRPRVAVRLRGMPPNTQGIGARIKVMQANLPAQSQEVLCGGRYLSGDDPVRVFAASTAAAELRIEVHWRSGRISTVAQAKPNRLYEIDEAQAQAAAPKAPSAIQTWFTNVSELIRHRHVEEPYDDFQRQPLLPFKLSQLGPGVAWFDLDGDGWEDLIVGSGRGGRLAAFHNNRQGGFVPTHGPPFEEVATRDQTSILGWVNTTGKSILIAGVSNYEDGQTNSPVARYYDLAAKTVIDLPSSFTASTGPIALADIEGTGNLDLFIGGRVVPGHVPEPAASQLLRYRGGQFQRDPAASSTLAQAGLVSGAVWSDLNGDALPELVLACQAGPIRVYRYERGSFKELTESLGLGKYLGLWNSISSGDFNGDGRMDLVAGNWGRNTKYQSHLAQPLHFYHGDLDGDGSVEIIEAYHDKELNQIVPMRDWGTLSAAMPFIREQYLSYTAFSTAGVSGFLGQRFATIRDLPLTTLDSMVFLNRGNHFEAFSLPGEAQFSPIFGLAVGDLDGDGHEDIVASQNFFEVPALTSRLDAGRGVLLKGDGRGHFSVVPGTRSGIQIYGEGRGLALGDFDHDGRTDLVAAQNAAATQLYRNQIAKPGLRILLKGPPGNPQCIGAHIRVKYRNGQLGPAREVHAGSGYWSQDAATQVLGLTTEPESIVIRWPGGKTTHFPLPTDHGSLKEVTISVPATP